MITVVKGSVDDSKVEGFEEAYRLLKTLELPVGLGMLFVRPDVDHRGVYLTISVRVS